MLPPRVRSRANCEDHRSSEERMAYEAAPRPGSHRDSGKLSAKLRGASQRRRAPFAAPRYSADPQRVSGEGSCRWGWQDLTDPGTTGAAARGSTNAVPRVG